MRQNIKSPQTRINTGVEGDFKDYEKPLNLRGACTLPCGGVRSKAVEIRYPLPPMAQEAGLVWKKYKHERFERIDSVHFIYFLFLMLLPIQNP